jgi:hypothetical protein
MKIHPHPEADEPFNYRYAVLWRRFLVFALGLSFLACLLALWVTGTVFGNPAQFLPSTLMFLVQQNRLVILIVPLLGLLVCYLWLRHVTGDIMVCPDRYLDERQKMVRDRAHHHAYKIVNFVCLLIVLCLSLNAILFPVRAGAPYKRMVSMRTIPIKVVKAGNIPLDESGKSIVQFPDTQSAPDTQSWKIVPPDMVIKAQPDPLQIKLKMAQGVVTVNTLNQYKSAGIVQSISEPVIWPNDPMSVSLFYGMLLLSLFLLVKVLPMSVVAWKERE